MCFWFKFDEPRYTVKRIEIEKLDVSDPPSVSEIKMTQQKAES